MFVNTSVDHEVAERERKLRMRTMIVTVGGKIDSVTNFADRESAWIAEDLLRKYARTNVYIRIIPRYEELIDPETKRVVLQTTKV